jgi:hypothetical protein
MLSLKKQRPVLLKELMSKLKQLHSPALSLHPSLPNAPTRQTSSTQAEGESRSRLPPPPVPIMRPKAWLAPPSAALPLPLPPRTAPPPSAPRLPVHVASSSPLRWTLPTFGAGTTGSSGSAGWAVGGEGIVPAGPWDAGFAGAAMAAGAAGATGRQPVRERRESLPRNRRIAAPFLSFFTTRTKCELHQPCVSTVILYRARRADGSSPVFYTYSFPPFHLPFQAAEFPPLHAIYHQDPTVQVQVTPPTLTSRHCLPSPPHRHSGRQRSASCRWSGRRCSGRYGSLWVVRCAPACVVYVGGDTSPAK